MTTTLDSATAGAVGAEGRAAADDHLSLRLWLRLLACSTQVERTLARRMREEGGLSLARFDVLAQLHRHPAGLTMSVLSGYLMVTGGNVTGLVGELEKEGLVARTVEPHDRRQARVTLTARGRRRFERLAAEHEQWVVELLGALPLAQRRTLHELLGRLRAGLATPPAPDVAPRRAARPTPRPRRGGARGSTR